MDFVRATTEYECWLGGQLTLIPADIKAKHVAMPEGLFPFFRATFYRWAQLWPDLSKDLRPAPAALIVGDLHVENSGTWRDAEGRLVWGVNDFDEAWPLPCTFDLVRVGGEPIVLAERHLGLRRMAVARLHDPGEFWRKMDKLPACRDRVPKAAAKALARLMPERGLACRIVHRVAGLGSLGRQRFTAIADWHGGRIAREVKALAPSACVWAAGGEGAAPPILYQRLLDAVVRCPDPFLTQRGRWILRRLAPDCSRIELSDLPRERDESRLLYAMGWETANIHLGSLKAKAALKYLAAQPPQWLDDAAGRMVDAVTADWREWLKRGP